ncbi:MAG: hypothetical protein AABY22_26680 [Nanoarchaeota archaeon]
MPTTTYKILRTQNESQRPKSNKEIRIEKIARKYRGNEKKGEESIFLRRFCYHVLGGRNPEDIDPEKSQLYFTDLIYRYFLNLTNFYDPIEQRREEGRLLRQGRKIRRLKNTQKPETVARFEKLALDELPLEVLDMVVARYIEGNKTYPGMYEEDSGEVGDFEKLLWDLFSNGEMISIFRDHFSDSSRFPTPPLLPVNMRARLTNFSLGSGRPYLIDTDYKEMHDRRRERLKVEWSKQDKSILGIFRSVRGAEATAKREEEERARSAVRTFETKEYIKQQKKDNLTHKLSQVPHSSLTQRQNALKQTIKNQKVARMMEIHGKRKIAKVLSEELILP